MQQSSSPQQAPRLGWKSSPSSPQIEVELTDRKLEATEDGRLPWRADLIHRQLALRLIT
jgi:hypothetical protein